MWAVKFADSRLDLSVFLGFSGFPLSAKLNTLNTHSTRVEDLDDG